jgi:orotidine-5'-phosphate decarboxylase
MAVSKELIIALDVNTAAEGNALVDRIGAAADFYKVAPTMALTEPSFIPGLIGRGKRVFLDCKWYDIPSQVRRSVETAGKMGVASCTIHTSAGRAVMEAAMSASKRPHVWGVTVLTSLGAEDLNEVGVTSAPAEQVLRLARLAQSVGLDGLVCSANEAAMLRRNGITLPLVTPGIQFGGVVNKDQKRTATPEEAWSAGADYIVVGRSILEAPDPAATARAIQSLGGHHG